MSQSEVGEANQKRIAAARAANATAPAGEILVLPAPEPLTRALTSTKVTALAATPPAVLLALAKIFFPNTGDEILLPVLGALWIFLNVAYKWYRNRREIASAPGVQDAPGQT